MPRLSVLSLLVRIAERAASFLGIPSCFDDFLNMRVELLGDFTFEPIVAKDIYPRAKAMTCQTVLKT